MFVTPNCNVHRATVADVAQAIKTESGYTYTLCAPNVPSGTEFTATTTDAQSDNCYYRELFYKFVGALFDCVRCGSYALVYAEHTDSDSYENDGFVMFVDRLG